MNFIYCNGSLGCGFFLDCLALRGSNNTCSQILFAPLLLNVWTICILDELICPFFKEMTWEICLPKLRWILLHSSQRKIPLLIDAHDGSKTILQKKNYLYNELLC